MESYLTVKKYARTEIEIKKSRFIASVAPVDTEEEAKDFVDKLKKEFKDATHNVHAYQVGLKGEIQRMSDDGEPQGTSGPPVLEVIKKEGLTNVVIVVTRYFGGIMLGAGGLIRAYGQAAKCGIDASGIVRRGLYENIELALDYQQLGAVQHYLTQQGFEVEETDYSHVVKLYLKVLVSEVDDFHSQVIEFTNGQMKIELLGQEWC
ncbi:putative YigZ family protein [Desulfitispora alkaliphila]|uniref:YigZ family protein n=1 Tax=Desulfitispora alkaliphila TaxID=622674 RepID=UPI003D1CCB5D